MMDVTVLEEILILKQDLEERLKKHNLICKRDYIINSEFC